MAGVYMDNGATTQVDERVLEAMLPFLRNDFGNPSSIHSFGRDVKKALEEAREKVAAAINAEPREIFFTSGGTEANNLALLGLAKARQKKGKHIITSEIEHHAVFDVCKFLEKEGFKVTFLPVDNYGLVSPADVASSITEETILVSVMMANNEVGTIQPIKEIGEMLKGKDIYFHTDAVQVIGNAPVDVNELGVDLLSMSAHKFYGPKGVGVLFLRQGTKIDKINHGGGQERRVRPGTENIPGIIGMGKAIELATAGMVKHAEKVTFLRDKLIKGLLNIEESTLNGHPEKRLPGNVNIAFAYIEGESLVLSLDLKGVAASSGSACTSGSLDPSHVLKAMNLPAEIINGSIRLTLGKNNTEKDIDYCLEVMVPIVERLRKLSSVYKPG